MTALRPACPIAYHYRLEDLAGAPAFTCTTLYVVGGCTETSTRSTPSRPARAPSPARPRLSSTATSTTSMPTPRRRTAAGSPGSLATSLSPSASTVSASCTATPRTSPAGGSRWRPSNRSSRTSAAALALPGRPLRPGRCLTGSGAPTSRRCAAPTPACLTPRTFSTLRAGTWSRTTGALACPASQAATTGVLIRLSVLPDVPGDSLYGLTIAGLRFDALPVDYDHSRWITYFLSTWPAGSPARRNYHHRIKHGTWLTADHAARGTVTCFA